MKPEIQIKLLDYLVQASEAELGLILTFATEDEAKLFRAKLYSVRKEFGEDYKNLGFILHAHELWIVKKETSDE